MHQEGFYIFSRFAHTKNMESQKMQALRLSLEIGAAMMESGGEVRRTEDTVTRINYAAGATDAQVWAVPGILTATVILADNTTHTGTSAWNRRKLTWQSWIDSIPCPAACAGARQ